MIAILFVAMLIFERQRLPNPLLPMLFLCVGIVISAWEGLF